MSTYSWLWQFTVFIWTLINMLPFFTSCLVSHSQTLPSYTDASFGKKDVGGKGLATRHYGLSASLGTWRPRGLNNFLWSLHNLLPYAINLNYVAPGASIVYIEKMESLFGLVLLTTPLSPHVILPDCITPLEVWQGRKGSGYARLCTCMSGHMLWW